MAIESRITHGTFVFGDWEVVEYIGSGSGGRTAVFLIVRKHDDWEEKAALKVVNILEEIGRKETLAETYRQEYDEERAELCKQAESEIRLMSHLKGNPYIVEYYDFLFVDYQDENTFGTDLLIRMELLTSLREERKRIGEYKQEEVVHIGKNICQGLKFCHQRGIIHRDIKPANIFVTAWGDYKLGDFGIARMVDAGQKASTKMGTRAYAAPEQFMSHLEKYDNRVDIYSLGLTLYELANNNRLPFASSGYVRESEIQLRIMGKEFPAPEKANPALADAIRKACAFEVDDRYASVEDFYEALMAAEVGVHVKEEKPAKNITAKEKTEKRQSAKKETEKKTASPKVTIDRAVIKKSTDTSKKKKGIIGAFCVVLVLMGVIFLGTFRDGQSAGENSSNNPGMITKEQDVPVMNDVAENDSVEEAEDSKQETEVAEEETKAEDSTEIAAEVLEREEKEVPLYNDGTVTMYVEQPEALLPGDNDFSPMYVHGGGDEGFSLPEGISISNEKYNEIFQGASYVTANKDNIAVITKTGDLYMWGKNEEGQTGCNSDEEQIDEPVKILENVATVKLADGYAAAITTIGDLYMWGDNRNFQIGNNSWGVQKTPVKILSDVKEVAFGDGCSGALCNNGDLYGWGNPNGNGIGIDKLTPTLIAGNVATFSMNHYEGGCVTKDGTLYMWGLNWWGQVGAGTKSEGLLTPVKIMDGMQSVHIGVTVSAAVAENGDLYMWGHNGAGQVGAGVSNSVVYAPVKVLSDVKNISISEYNIAAITDSSELYMWGGNLNRQLGLTEYNQYNSPQYITDGVKQVVMNSRNTAIVKENGDLYMCGMNTQHQINDSDEWKIEVPTKVAENVSSVATGWECTYLVDEDGNFYSLGE